MKMGKVLALKEQIPINEKSLPTIPISFLHICRSIYQSIVRIDDV
jgi:hypothetical protein